MEDRDPGRKPDSVKDALMDTADSYTELAEDLQTDLKSPNTMEEVLKLAERTSLEVLALLPLSPVYCPFCSIYTDCGGCENCKYAADYGICSETGSLYHQVLEAHYGLVGAIESFPGQSKKIVPSKGTEVAKDVLSIGASNLAKIAKNFRSEIQKASSPEDIMTVKKDFMIELVSDLPLEKVCSHCDLEHLNIIRAKEEALLGLDRHWAAA